MAETRLFFLLFSPGKEAKITLLSIFVKFVDCKAN